MITKEAKKQLHNVAGDVPLRITVKEVDEFGRPVSAGSSAPSECAANKLHVKAREGDAILFWSLKGGGELDKGSKHGSCPVLKGEKWSATKWYHVYDFKSPPHGKQPKVYDTEENDHKWKEDLGGFFSTNDGRKMAGCDDLNDECESWASNGECEKNPSFMTQNCRLSCNLC